MKHQQKLIFTQLLSDYGRLQAENERLKASEKNTPSLDWQLYAKRHDRIDDGEGLDVSDDEGDWDADELEARAVRRVKYDPNTNGHVMKEKYTTEWRYASPEDTAYAEMSTHRMAENNFDIMTLLSHGGEDSSSELTICDHAQRKSCGFSYREHHHLYERISSQLLYYRLASVFGMPPVAEVDGYKCAWWAHLVFIGPDGKADKDGEFRETGYLSLGDWKVSSTASFQGDSKEVLDKALALMSFLTGLNCPHTYDGIVCGTQA